MCEHTDTVYNVWAYR